MKRVYKHPPRRWLTRFAHHPRTPWFLTLSTIIISISCFLEKELPPTFRFSCEEDAQCANIQDENGQTMYVERCIDGLCQYPCTTSLLDEFSDCPPNRGLLCFNGVCSNLCDPSAEPPPCSSPHACQALSIPEGLDPMDFTDVDLSAFTSGLGVCAIPCDANNPNSCPQGQACLDGVCLTLPNLGGMDGDTL